jgi:hypothetical protein
LTLKSPLIVMLDANRPLSLEGAGLLIAHRFDGFAKY